MSEQVQSPAYTNVRRSVTLVGATSTVVGFVIGASIFILPGPVAGTVGPGLPVAYLLAAIPAAVTCLYLVQLGAVLPVTGSNYIAATRFGAPLAGFLVVWMFISCAVFAIPVMAIGFASYLRTILPAAPTVLTAVAVIALLCIVNLFGVKAATIAQTILTVLFVAALLAYIVGGLPNIDLSNYENPFPYGIDGLLVGSVTVYFSFTGFTVISEIAGEVKNARKTIPYSLMISLVVILVIYIGVGTTLTGTVNWRQVASSPAAIADSAASFYPDQLVTLISLGALFASATTINALLTSVSRDILKLGRDSVLPRAFGNVSRRFGTPYAGVLSVTVVVIMTLLIGLDIEQYSTITVFSFLLMQCICAVAVFRIPNVNRAFWNRSPIRFTRGWRTFILIALIGTSLLIFGFATVDDATTASVFAVVLCIGFVFWLVRSRFLAAKGINLTTNMRQLSDDIADEMNDEDR